MSLGLSGKNTRRMVQLRCVEWPIREVLTHSSPAAASRVDPQMQLCTPTRGAVTGDMYHSVMRLLRPLHTTSRRYPFSCLVNEARWYVYD
jgi:hypothetical protein